MRVVAASIVVLVALAGCAAVPVEPESPVRLPESFSDGGETPLPDRWWTVFGDSDLDALVERAVAGNFSLRAAWSRLEQARAKARKAGAALSPTLDVQSSVSRSRAVNTIETPTGGENRTTTYSTGLNAGLVAGYEVDLWGRVRSSRDAAALDAEATEADLRTAAMTLAAEVATSWFRLSEQAEQIALLDGQIETNERILELTELRFRRGQVGAEDVLRQRQVVEAKCGERIAARETAEVLELSLAVLVGETPDGSVVERRGKLVALPDLPATGLPADLIGRRPDVASAWIRVLVADRRTAAAVADRYPRLSLSARVETSGAEVSDLFSDWLASLAANLTAPLIDGGSRAAEVDRTRAAASEALSSYGQTVLEAIEDVETALVQESRQRESIASLEKQIVLLAGVLERTQDAYTKGAGDYLRVLDALGTQQALQRSLLSARLDLVLNRVDLCRALGGGWTLVPPASPKELAKMEKTS
jgi:outer membrane protein, multidrug efflux system